MTAIIIYQKPTCTTCRQVYGVLKGSGVDFDVVDYYVQPIPKTRLKELIRKMGISASELLRTKEEKIPIKNDQKKPQDDIAQ